MKTQSPTEKRPLWGGPAGHGHGQDDRQQLGHGQVPGRAVEKGTASRCRDRAWPRAQVSGRERVDRERVEHALFGADGAAIYGSRQSGQSRLAPRRRARRRRPAACREHTCSGVSPASASAR